ncbi:MAG: LamB/YcsF family protein [Clostridiales bacterium]|nr:LamB/YcsF family protein [Clostridiales bacterium]
MKISIDLNADLGENIGDDEKMLGIVTSANIACGAHAGDAHTMDKTVALAVQNKVAIGAHPGFWDKANFGRTLKAATSIQVYDIIMYQTGALMAFCIAHKCSISHIKPHGALYNILMVDKHLAQGAVLAAKALHLPIMGMPYSQLQDAAQEMQVGFIAEGFADRAYMHDGTLMQRTKDGAVLHHEDALRQAISMVVDQEVLAEGKLLDMKVQSICIHGDTAGAVSIAMDIKKKLYEHNVVIKQASQINKNFIDGK